MSDNKNPRIVYLSNTALFAVLATLQTWFFTVYAYLGDRNPVKQAVCTALSVAAAIFLSTVGRRAMGGRWPVKRGEQIGLTGFQAGWVVLLVIAGGCFHLWMLK
jgi:hypothetical protein